MKTILVSLLVPLFFLNGCGENDPVVTTGPKNGQVIGEVTMTIPKEARAGLLQNRSQVQDLGYALSADGTSVIYPNMIPTGWKVTLGDAVAFVGKEGSFTINVIAGGATEGKILNPITGETWATFTVSDLAEEGGTPTTIKMLIDSIGPRLMDTGGTCCQSLKSSNGILNNSSPTGKEVECLDYDGPINHGQNGDYLSYLGSTCQTRVWAGCCPNENGTVGQRLFPESYTYSSCVENHKGRWCQEVKPDDLVVTPSGTVEVSLGASTSLTLHNNACFGETNVLEITKTLGGTLAGDGFASGLVKHYSGTSSANYKYVTDRTLTTTAPKCVSSKDLKDEYQFVADSTTGSVTFQIKNSNLWQFTTGTSTGTIFSGDGVTIASSDTNCDSRHVHGSHPCTAASDPDPVACGHGKVTQISP